MAGRETSDGCRISPELQRFVSGQKQDCLTLRKRQFHYLPAGEDKFVWIVCSGVMLSVRISANGKLKGMVIFGPGDILGINGLGGDANDVCCYAMTNVSLKRVSMREFRDAIDTDPKFCRYMLNYVSKRYAELLDELENSVLLSLEDRMTAFRAKIANRLSTPVAARLPEQVLAWAVGAHPVSVCRALKRR
jgi:CRP-like cAMP-binding protein